MSDTENPVLSVRIALDNPSVETATLAAQRLLELGLKIAHVSARGILISGSREEIEQALDTRIDFRDKVVQFKDQPKFEKLPRRGGYRAYFPREPTYF